jgi:tetratricopeptide (TPR) repeat protein
MSEQLMMQSAEELRQLGFAKARSEEFDEAIALYDHALSVVADEELRELITINKADAMIAIERGGAEVQALPAILMRRRNPRHTFLAAYALMFKHRIVSETKRAIFYGQVALDAATAAGEAFWLLGALNELGIIYETDSQFAKAIECFEHALTELDALTDEKAQVLSRFAVIANLGYNKLLVGETVEGLRMIHSVIDQIDMQSGKCDSLLDLCYGYLDLEQYAKARAYGEAGLEIASEPRQVRNAHYLLGEAAYKMGDTDAAEAHFEELARYYPQFRNLKSLLFAIDLRSMINFKL